MNHPLLEEIPWAMRGKATVEGIRQWSIEEYRRMNRWKNGLTVAFFLQIAVLAGFLLLGQATSAALLLETVFGAIMIIGNFVLYKLLRRKQRSYVLTDGEIQQLLRQIEAEMAREEEEFEARIRKKE